jgi:hypothetical protein
MEKYFKYSQCFAPVYCTVHYNQMETETAALLGDQVFGPAPFLTSSSRLPSLTVLLKMITHTHRTAFSQIDFFLTLPATSREVQPKLKIFKTTDA